MSPCPSCGTALTDSARFCASCGSPVAPACPACGSELPTGARFCPACGASVASDATAPTSSAPESARERKVATLLFADIVGFTELGERLDAEVVSRLVADAFERLSAEVERYGGTVEKYAGDAMLAVFGVPTTHEDDPERAVRAAIEMQAAMARGTREAADTDLLLRIGIESGDVLADVARSTSERDLFVTGDAVNTASRLQAAADPGAVVVGPGTYASTRDLFEYEELEPRPLKGKALPVSSWRAIRVRTRRGARRPPLGIEAPLIGRDEELALLQETVRRAVAAGKPHLITVTGEAGIGKTRLIWELEKYLDGLPDTFHWRKGRCYSYAALSYSPLVEIVKADATIAEDDPPKVMAEKLDARFAELGIGQAAAIQPAVRTLLGLPGSDSRSQAELFEAWRTYLAAIAMAHPLVLVVEDIHWADAATLDFLELLARWADAPIAIICLARPELLERRTTWGGGIRNASLVELSRLDADRSARMVTALLGEALPPPLRDRLVAIANGNPLFTEELVRMFADQGIVRMVEGGWRFTRPVDEISIPDSVQAVLSARLDELDPAEKRTAQEASVVGRIFWDVILAHLRSAEPATVTEELQRLRVKELVSPRAPSTLTGAGEWSFHHVLVRDVAYESLPKGDRARLHLAVARWADHALAERSDEFAELVASHRLAALGYLEELQASRSDDPAMLDLRQDTMDAAVRAARRAAEVRDLPTARRWQLVAIAQARLLERPPLERGRLALEFQQLTDGELDASERIAVLQPGVDLVAARPDLDTDGRALLARLRAGLAEALYTGERKAEAKAMLEEAASELEPDRPSAARALVLRVWCWTLWHDYEFDEAATIAQAAMAEATEAGADDVYRVALHESAVIDSFRGRVAESIDKLQSSLALAEAAGDAALVARCLVNLSAVSSNNGYPVADSIERVEPGVESTRRSGSYVTLSFLLQNLTAIYLLTARSEEALAQADEQFDVTARAGNPHMVGTIHLQRAEALLALGRREEAASALRSALDTWTDDPQHREHVAILEAALEFPRQPQAALESLVSSGDDAVVSTAISELARWQGRLAYRLSEQAAIRDAVRRHEGISGELGPARVLERRWLQALRDGDLALLERAAREMHELGYVRIALEMDVDAALMGARQGQDDGRTQATLERCLVFDYHPWLGSLPEERWIAGGVVSAA